MAPVTAREPSASTPAWTRKEFTTAPVQAANTSNMPVEFCRVNDAQRIWGLKRGLIYLMIKNGTIRSVLHRERGGKGGIRLLYVESIRSCLMAEMEAQEAAGKPNSGEADGARPPNR